LNQWTLFDDKVVKKQNDWYEVAKNCIESMIKPTMLFFQKVHPDASPIDPKRAFIFSEKDLYFMEK
jgi:hypothetical protein